MKNVRRIVASLTILLGASLASTACGGTDPAAAKACLDSAKKDADTCKACCSAAGSNGHIWTPNACRCP